MTREEFNMDSPDLYGMMMAHIDWLQETGCESEAELMNIEWGYKIGTLSRTDDNIARAKKLREELKFKPTKTITKEVGMGTRQRSRVSCIFDDAVGAYFTRASLNIVHVMDFLAELHEQPLLSLAFNCNGVAGLGLAQTYLNYKWLQKVMNWEFSGLNVDFLGFKRLINSGTINAQNLVINTMNRNDLPTDDQMRILPLTIPTLRYLKTLKYNGKLYTYTPKV